MQCLRITRPKIVYSFWVSEPLRILFKLWIFFPEYSYVQNLAHSIVELANPSEAYSWGSLRYKGYQVLKPTLESLLT